MARRLVSTVRDVPAGRVPDYAASWARVRAAVEATGAHAWAFAASGHASRRIEFIEYPDGSDPRDAPEVTRLMAALDREFGGETDEWEEAG